MTLALAALLLLALLAVVAWLIACVADAERQFLAWGGE